MTVSNELEFLRGKTGHETFLRIPADHVDAMVLAATTPETYTVPSGARFLVFSSNADFYVRKNAAGAVPGSEVSDGSGSELNPAGYAVYDGDGTQVITTLGFESAAACVVTIAAYK